MVFKTKWIRAAQCGAGMNHASTEEDESEKEGKGSERGRSFDLGKCEQQQIGVSIRTD